MDFRFSKEQLKLKQDVNDFIKKEKKRGIYPFADDSGLGYMSKEFTKEMAKKGFIGVAWPKECGGQGLGYVERGIVFEEMFKAGAPIGQHYLSDRQIGPGIIHFGSQFLKDEFLPKMIQGDISFCLLFSEPDAGSDLARCTTTAVEENDCFIINGQKVWTSHAHTTEFGWALVKTDTDPNVSRYNSFSEIIVDMKTPGITIRPIINMIGEHSFNEVFFDNVKVPKKYLVGKLNNGFKQIMKNLDYERSGIDRLMQNLRVKDALINYVKTVEKDGKPLSKDPLIRDTIAQLEIEFQVGKKYIYYVTSLLDKGELQTHEAAIGKVFCTSYEAKLADVASSIMGVNGLLMPKSPKALFNGMVAESYLASPSFTIQGGSVEVLKTIIGKRGLKLAAK